MNIEQVKDFIRTANREELREISKMHNSALVSYIVLVTLKLSVNWEVKELNI